MGCIIAMDEDLQQRLNPDLRRKASRHFRERLDSMSLMDDYFFTPFMQDNSECMDILLQTVIGREDIHADRVVTQRQVNNFNGKRGVRFDAQSRDEDGTIYKVEVENSPRGNMELRLRFYAAMTDKDLLEKGQNFDELPAVYQIVFMRRDVAGKGEPISCVRRCIIESEKEISDSPKIFNDKEVILYVDVSYKNDNTRIGKLIHDMTTPNSERKYIKAFQDAVDNIIRTEEGRESMAESIIDLASDDVDLGHLLSESERLESRAEGRAEGRAETYQALLDAGILKYKVTGQSPHIPL